ncbi:MAG: signal peptide peptidase SppA [Methanomicrobiales archaeon]|nr:signal peptide peptidase SppA [Methanomicrobiales archaeon]
MLPDPADQKSRKKSHILFIIAILAVILAAAVIAVMLPQFSRELGISVIGIEGVIVTGESGNGYAGSVSVGGAIRNAADDPMVDAIVLRINSPGGTPAGAQEIVADILYAKERKPVVVSMGDIATSSAYYISAYADRIYASPDTLTGGIGTAWIFTDISGWMTEENLEVEVIKSGSMKDMGAEYRPLTEEERQYAGEIVNQSAERFIRDILSQRPIDRSMIEDARIFRGEEALDLGLIDEIGNLHDAIAGARALS